MNFGPKGNIRSLNHLGANNGLLDLSFVVLDKNFRDTLVTRTNIVNIAFQVPTLLIIIAHSFGPDSSELRYGKGLRPVSRAACFRCGFLATSKSSGMPPDRSKHSAHQGPTRIRGKCETEEESRV